METTFRRYSWVLGGLAALAVVEPGTASAGAAPAQTCPAPAARAAIVHESENLYTLDRSVIERTLANTGELTRSVRIVPELRQGRAVGLRLYSVKPYTTIAILGLRNGDIVRSLNSVALTSPESALRAYTQLTGSPRHLALEIERDGRTVVLDYWIH
jgi:general secretion pathway protein C